MAGHGASSSSSNSNSFIYDVFLSFRGKDTRGGFTSHLFEALRNEGIETFRDDPSLQSGDEIRSTLLEAIEKSRMSIVVLSEEYASTSWCLDELVKIMECHKDQRRRVIPVFYHVDPSDVRYQKNQYAEAMEKHENGRNKDKVTAWRSALSAVASLSGHHFCKNGSSYESDLVKKIATNVSEELRRVREPLLINLPDELADRIEEVKSRLDVGSRHSQPMLYIYGGDETETTKLVAALYNKIFHEFEVACLVENVSTKSKKSATGMEELQKALLSKIVRKEQHIVMCNRYEGKKEIKQRLQNRRVLLILDNVDSVEQLESLAGGADWFGPGSRIIITTRDEDLPDEHVIDGFEIIKRCRIDGGELIGMEAWGEEEEEDVVGFDEFLKIVINQLKEEEPSDRNVVCITGMCGLGKTTLARKIFNNSEVKNLFPRRAWCCVSKDFNERKVFLGLLKSLKGSTSKYKRLNEKKLKEEVRKCLSRKKYLVVLDDIWEHEVLNKVKYAFPTTNKGGMILITSRNDEMARHKNSRSPHHKVPALDAEKGWELFRKKVFALREECPSELETIGKSIVDKCGGLPLAILAIAKVVAKKGRSEREWSQINDFFPWYLARDKNNKEMDRLKDSFNDLSEELKTCFLYFGVFPEDHVIVASKLVLLWMAEGFIQPGKTRTSKVPRPEDVGDKYLDELVDLNLVQVVARRTLGGGVKLCRIHALLRELCISESQANDNNFLEVCTESTNNNFLGNYRRLSFLCDPSKFMSSIEGNQLSAHSLFFFPDCSFSYDIVKNFPELHVLHVENGVASDPYHCDLKMIHLKYMRIRDSSREDNPCSWFSSLDNLQTLDLCGGGYGAGPYYTCIWKLNHLRHIYASFPLLEGDEEGGNRKQIRWNLQTLSTMVMEPRIMRLINEGIFPNLKKLKLSFEYGENEPWMCKCDLHLLSNLSTLSIDFCLKRFSSSFVFPPNICKITFKNLPQVEDSCMSALGRIPSLRVLKLDLDLKWEGGHGGDTLHCGADEDFPKLYVFHIKGYNMLRRLTLENGAMPNLRRMVFDFVWKDLKVPERLLPFCEFNNCLEVHEEEEEEEEEIMLKEIENESPCIKVMLL